MIAKNGKRFIYKHRKKILAYALISLFFLIVTIYPQVYIKLPKGLQILFFAIFFVLNVFVGPIIDEFKLGQLFQKLKSEKKTLEGLIRSKTSSVEELQRLIARFINFSYIYRQNVIDKLNIDEEFLCIVKSSEGFGKVWEKLDPKPMLPFTKVLSEWPGAIKPFENGGLFIIPIRNAPNIKSQQIRKWVKDKLIPKVKKHRRILLKSIPTNLRKDVDRFSFKYIAFILRKNSIDYDHENRKFNESFVQFIVQNQAKRTLSSITENLTGIIRIKDVFTSVEWDAFVEDFNEEQSALINSNRQTIAKLLNKKKINGIVGLSKMTEEDLTKVIESALGKETSHTKSKNISKKILSGAKNAIRILESAGVQL